MDGQAVPAGFLWLAQLGRSPVLWPDDIDELRSWRVPRKRPLPHSQAAIRAVCDGFRDYGRGQLVGACGTGKTLIRLWAFEEIGCELALVLVPSLSLLAQTLRECTSNAASPFNWFSYASRSWREPFVKLARTIRHYRASIEATIEWKPTNGTSESNNAAIGRIRSAARGFHDPESFITMIMLDRAGIAPQLPWATAS
jgi:hypothetical protein